MSKLEKTVYLVVLIWALWAFGIAIAISYVKGPERPNYVCTENCQEFRLSKEQ